MSKKMAVPFLISFGCVTICSGLFASTSAAAVATGNFAVSITIEAQCVINSAPALNFGTTGVIGTAVAASATLSVQCTNTTGYVISLSAGGGTGATTAARKMTGGSETVTYSLYSNAGHTTVWGSNTGVDTVAGTGTGAAVNHIIYGLVPAQTTPAPGAYTDTINVTITY